MVNDMSEATQVIQELIGYKNRGPISILECRSGLRVFMITNQQDDSGVNLAYLTQCNNSFEEMIKTAIKNLDKNIDANGKEITTR